MKSKGLFMTLAASAAGLVAPAILQAEETEIGLGGQVGFGYAEARGNSDTLSITGNTDLQYVTEGPWLYDAKLLFVTREEASVTTEERYEARGTANYYWSEGDYFYGRIDWRKDNFGGVREEWVPSIGYGRVILDTDVHSLNGEVGVGYRFADLADGTSEEGGVLSGGLRYAWQISPSAQFIQNLLIQWSSDNTYAESETGLETTIVGNLAAKISYVVKHNTDVPAGNRNSDFYTTIGLEYRF
ncbi:DUF481 domain-containing protein [Wenzhouxiangella sp. XN24]|uniref:DUF481 domain-containing protein n=1 Tax=Wenzhouxiangella sp. XN24 TaxID=2713569 RepID=UPI0013EBF30A|nr:DUF481 domain-containing protein [Wenzhouxiangella sp. XN24]